MELDESVPSTLLHRQHAKIMDKDGGFGMTSLKQLLAAVLFTSSSMTPALAAAQAQTHEHFDYYHQATPRAQKLLHLTEEYHLKKGINLLKQGKCTYALSDFQFILNYFPNHPEVLYRMIDWGEQCGKPNVPEQRIKQAIETYPDAAQTYTIYGIFLHREGKLKEATEQYHHALELTPDSGQTHYNLGLAYFELGDYEAARKQAKAAYQGGFPLPGLKQKLSSVGQWKE